MNIMDYSLLVGIQQVPSQEKTPLTLQQNEVINNSQGELLLYDHNPKIYIY